MKKNVINQSFHNFFQKNKKKKEYFIYIYMKLIKILIFTLKKVRNAGHFAILPAARPILLHHHYQFYFRYLKNKNNINEEERDKSIFP